MYAHGVYEVDMQGITPAPSGGTDSGPTLNQHVGLFLGGVTGTVAEWHPGFIPHQVIGVAYVQMTGQSNAAAIQMRFQHIKGAASTVTNIATIHVPTTVTSLGRPNYYKVSGYVEIKPGEGVRVAVTLSPTAGVAGALKLLVAPRWEEPGNVTNMVLTTGLPSDA
jgi:hypothetical protein